MLATTEAVPTHPTPVAQAPDATRCEKRGERDYEALFLENLEYIEHVLAFVTRRHALSPCDAQDFGSWVKLRLIQNDYAVLRKFKGRCKLTTFLTTVIHNLHRDFRIQRWGKWRSSVAARRHGEVGVQLEVLLFRDGFSLDEAIRSLLENHEVDASPAELEAIAAELRPRVSRRFEPEEALAGAVAAERADDRLVARERADGWLRLLGRVRHVLSDLEPEDRRIVTMRFEEGLSVAAISRQLGLDQRQLYTRVNRLMTDLRRRLESAAPEVRSQAA